jgi:hypothetical protein
LQQALTQSVTEEILASHAIAWPLTVAYSSEIRCSVITSMPLNLRHETKGLDDEQQKQEVLILHLFASRSATEIESPRTDL